MSNCINWPTRGWGIVNRATRRLYIPKTLWLTKQEADTELEALLKPYPEDSKWRKRLGTMFVIRGVSGLRGRPRTVLS